MNITDTPAADGTVYRTIRWNLEAPSSVEHEARGALRSEEATIISASRPTRIQAGPGKGTWIMTIHYLPGPDPEPDEDRDLYAEPDPDAYVEDHLLEDRDAGLR